MFTPSPPPEITRSLILPITAVLLLAVASTALIPLLEKRVMVNATCTPWLWASAMIFLAVAPPQPCTLVMLPLALSSAENHASWVSWSQCRVVPETVQ